MALVGEKQDAVIISAREAKTLVLAEPWASLDEAALCSKLRIGFAVSAHSSLGKDGLLRSQPAKRLSSNYH